MDGRTDRWERVSLCRVSLFLCSVCWLHDCPYSSYTSPILLVQRGLHDCHSLPPSPTHTPPHTAQPPRAVLTARLSGLCVCSAQLCRRSGGAMARSPEDCSVYFWEPLHRQCPRDVVFNSNAGAYEWVVIMDCVDSRSDPGESSTRTTAAKSTATQKFMTKRIRRFR